MNKKGAIFILLLSASWQHSDLREIFLPKTSLPEARVGPASLEAVVADAFE